MKLKIVYGKLDQVDRFNPIKQEIYEPKTPLEASMAFKKFFTDNPDLPTPQDVDLILQSGDAMTISSILSIKYFLYENGLGLEFYAFDDSEESLLSDLTVVSGMLLLDEAHMFYGFIPRGYFLKFDSETDANPIKVYNWVGNTVKLFPSVSSDPYQATLDKVKEYSEIVGTVSTPVMNRLMKYLASFKKRLVLI